MALDEKILVYELKGGNTKAYEILFFHYYRKLYSFSYRITGNTQEAEDLVQEVFIFIWNNRDKLDENRSFGGFLFKIAKNRALNIIKSRLTRQIHIHYKQNNDNVHWDREIETGELMEMIHKSLTSLPKQTQQIFMLSRNEGLTYKEIAKKLNISENIVDHEIRKALKVIKEYLSAGDYL